MSIWGSHDAVGHDRWLDGHEVRGGEVRSYATGWSNHYPTTDGLVEQPAHVGIGSIPYFCVPGWRDEDESDVEEHTVGPWLRLDVVTHVHDERGQPTGQDTHAAVVMDEAAARLLAADLLAWADTPKVQPR